VLDAGNNYIARRTIVHDRMRFYAPALSRKTCSWFNTGKQDRTCAMPKVMSKDYEDDEDDAWLDLIDAAS
jgi:hypothetical protein